MRKALAAVVTIAMFGVACAQSAAEKQAEELKAAAEKTAAAAQEMAKAAEKGAGGAADLAKAMQGMAAAMSGSPDGKPVEPVSIDVLKSALPTISGWEMDAPKSERMTMPVPFSQTETTYKQGNKEIELKVVDTGFAQLLVAPISMMLATGYNRETDDGYEKGTVVAGNPAWEKWNKRSKHGELGVLYGKRFLVTIEGNDLGGINELHDIASKVDFGKLK